MKEVLVSSLMMQGDQSRFAEWLKRHGVHATFHAARQFLTEEELLPLAGKFDGVIAGDDQFSERVMQAWLPRLQVISKWGVGLDAIDLEAARRLDIQVFNTPGAFASAVAEVCLGYILMWSRQLHVIDRAVRQGEWPKIPSVGLAGQALGLIGFGAIGQAIARRAIAFDMPVVAYDFRMEQMPPVEGVTFQPFDHVLAQADFLCLACSLTAENHHLIGAAELARMKPTACLLNVARGPLVHEAALVTALRDQRLAGAALDVYEQEPPPEGHPLTSMPQVILGSHNANNVHSANERVHAMCIVNLLRGLGIEL